MSVFKISDVQIIFMFPILNFSLIESVSNHLKNLIGEKFRIKIVSQSFFSNSLYIEV